MKARWLYLALWLAVVWVWCGLYAWMFDGFNVFEWVMQVVAYFWTDDMEALPRANGMFYVWGYDIPDWWHRWPREVQIAFESVGVSIPLLVMTMGISLTVGVGRRQRAALPAKRRMTLVARGFATLFLGLLIAALTLEVIDRVGWYDSWNSFYLRYHRQDRFQFSTGSHTYSTTPVTTWVPHAAWLLSAGWLFAAGCLWWFARARDRYWKLETLTKWVIVVAILVLLWKWLAWPLLGSGRNYWWWDWMLDPDHTVIASALTCLVWALGVRTWLLFRLRQYEVDRAAQQRDAPECVACEYDLRGSLAGGAARCPECGHPVPDEVVRAFAAGEEARARSAEVPAEM